MHLRSTVDKILGFMYLRVLFNKKGLIYSLQFSFREKLSTALALIQLTDTIIN